MSFFGQNHEEFMVLEAVLLFQIYFLIYFKNRVTKKIELDFSLLTVSKEAFKWEPFQMRYTNKNINNVNS